MESFTNYFRSEFPTSWEEQHFHFADDPLLHDQLTQTLLLNLENGNLVIRNPRDETIELFISNQKSFTAIENYIVKLHPHLTAETTRKIYINTIFNKRFLDLISQERITQPDKIDELRAGVETYLDSLLGSPYEKSSVVIQILTAHGINPVTVWYAKNAFLELEQTLMRLVDQPNGEQKILVLAILGYSLGLLDKTAPNAKQKYFLLRSYLNGKLPSFLTNLDFDDTDQEAQPPQLQALKKFWQNFFVLSWVANARAQSLSGSSLSAADVGFANQKLLADNRSAQSFSGASSQAESFAARSTDPSQARQAVTQDYLRQQYLLERQAETTKNDLRKNLESIISNYFPGHQAIFDQQQRLVGPWAILKQKSGLIFKTLITKGAPLTQKLSKAQTQQELLHIADSLRDALKTGVELRETELFGSDFGSRAAIEQICLISFSCLALNPELTSTNQVVFLISNFLQPILENHIHFTLEHEEPEPDWTFGEKEKNTPDVQHGLAKLATHSFLDGLILSNNPDLKELLETEYFLLEPVQEMLIKPRERETTLLFFQVMLAFIFGMDAILAAYIDEVPYIAAPLALTIGTINIFGFYSVLIQEKMLYTANSRYQKELQNYQILAEDYQKKLKALQNGYRYEKREKFKTIRNTSLALFFSIFFLISLQQEYQLFEGLIESNFQTGSENPFDTFNFESPDFINPETLRNMPHVFHGTVLHFPESFTETEGRYIGYSSYMKYYGSGAGFGESPTEEYVPFLRYSNLTPEILARDLQPAPEQLVYEVEYIDSQITPLAEWKIVKVYQEGGHEGQISNFGSILYPSSDELPRRVILVLEPRVGVTYANGAVTKYEGISVFESYPWQSWSGRGSESSMNSDITDDPALHQLHTAMITDADALVARWQAKELSDAEMTDLFSELVTDYSLRFAEYVRENRYYSLRYRQPKTANDLYPNVSGIAQQPEAGYYCKVGNLSIEEFMESIGIMVLQRPGAATKSYRNGLYSRIPHVNSIVLLPNGEVLFTDMTPPNPNPGEDLSMLEDFPPNFSEPGFPWLESALLLGAGGVSAAVLRRKVKKRRASDFEKRLVNSLPEENATAQRTLHALEMILSHCLEIAGESSPQPEFMEQSLYPDKKRYIDRLAWDAAKLLTPSFEPSETAQDVIRKTLTGYATTIKEGRKTKEASYPVFFGAELTPKTKQELAKNITRVKRAFKKHLKTQLTAAEGKLAEYEEALATKTEPSHQELSDLHTLKWNVYHLREGGSALQSMLSLLIRA